MLLDKQSSVFKMNRRVMLHDLNPHLMCVLCGGYYVDATTIIECVHSFCRSCIVKHLESSKYCPICEVMVHKTRPLMNIRRDKTLQDIVYKLVPGLFAREMQERRQFYLDRPHYVKPEDVESGGEVSDERKSYICDDSVSLSLTDHGSENPPWFLRCPVNVTIQHLKKLVLTKYGFKTSKVQVELLLKNQVLDGDLTLLDIACLHPWRSKETLDLTYAMLGVNEKKAETEESEEKNPLNVEKESLETDQAQEHVVEKEVQLQITESGVMSISEIDTRTPNHSANRLLADVSVGQSVIADLRQGETQSSGQASGSTNQNMGANLYANHNKQPSLASNQGLSPAVIGPAEQPIAVKPVVSSVPLEPKLIRDARKKRPSIEESGVKPKRPSLSKEESPLRIMENRFSPSLSKTPKNQKDEEKGRAMETKMPANIPKSIQYPAAIANRSDRNSQGGSGFYSVNKARQDSAPSGEPAGDSSATSTEPKPVEPATVVPRLANDVGLAVVAPVKPPSHHVVAPARPRSHDVSLHVAPAKPMQDAAGSSAKPSTPGPPSVGPGSAGPAEKSKHKPIRVTPQPWRPMITKEKLRPTLMSNMEEPRKPSKFFKRQNAPRFLGNPASGVKPLYSNGLPAPSPPSPQRKLDQIVRIDPKSLRAIQKEEKKAPNTLLTNPFIPRDNHFLLPDPKKPPFVPVNFPVGFHASLPPSISLLLNPHQHFRNLKAREDAAKLCDSASSPDPRPSASASKPAHPAPSPGATPPPTPTPAPAPESPAKCL